jgi:polyisoprenoid-binding protein YceI
MLMRSKLVFFITLLVVLTATSLAQPAQIDTSRSTLTVHVYKTGLFSGLAHNHIIKAPIASGTVDPERRTVVLAFNASEFQLMDTEGSESDHREIETTMKGPKVLDVAQFPSIGFRSKRVDTSGPDRYSVVGELNLHGTTREITVPVALSSGVYRGTVNLKQTDFGITPVKIAGGAVRVKDEIEISFEIVTR